MYNSCKWKREKCRIDVQIMTNTHLKYRNILCCHIKKKPKGYIKYTFEGRNWTSTAEKIKEERSYNC